MKVAAHLWEQRRLDDRLVCWLKPNMVSTHPRVFPLPPELHSLSDTDEESRHGWDRRGYEHSNTSGSGFKFQAASNLLPPFFPRVQRRTLFSSLPKHVTTNAIPQATRSLEIRALSTPLKGGPSEYGDSMPGEDTRVTGGLLAYTSKRQRWGDSSPNRPFDSGEAYCRGKRPLHIISLHADSSRD